MEQLSARLGIQPGETTSDGLFTWTPIYPHTLVDAVGATLSVTDKDYGRDTQFISVHVESTPDDADGMLLLILGLWAALGAGAAKLYSLQRVRR